MKAGFGVVMTHKTVSPVLLVNHCCKREDYIFADSCPDKSSVEVLDTIWSNDYSGKNLETNNACEIHHTRGTANYWHAIDGKRNQRVLLDQGCKRKFSRVFLRNSKNAFYRNM